MPTDVLSILDCLYPTNATQVSLVLPDDEEAQYDGGYEKIGTYNSLPQLPNPS